MRWLATMPLLLLCGSFHEPPGKRPGCAGRYVEFAGATLVAHAGGGLPEATYTNSRRALDLAVAHGFSLIEMDFSMVGGTLRIGHDLDDISALTVPELAAWLRRHPGVSVVADMKDDNGPLRFLRPRDRFIAQIYDPSEYAGVRALGFRRIIFTAYRMPRDDWQDEVNRLDLFAVTIPVEKRQLARGVRHPVFLHTVDRPLAADGLYTNCLIPPQSPRRAGTPA